MKKREWKSQSMKDEQEALWEEEQEEGKEQEQEQKLHINEEESVSCHFQEFMSQFSFFSPSQDVIP